MKKSFQFSKQSSKYKKQQQPIPISVIRDCAALSSMAYLPPEQVAAKWSAKETPLLARMKNPPVFYDGNRNNIGIKRDCQMYVANVEDTNTTFVAFRGTSDKEDMIADANVFLRHMSENMNALVHTGFYEQYQSIAPDLNQLCARLARAPAGAVADSHEATFVFTGHSLGAAVAAIAGTCYKCKNIIYVGFGSPRVGDAKFKEFFNSRVSASYRIVAPNDEIPLIPALPKYAHVCDALLLGATALEYKKPQKNWFMSAVQFILDMKKPIQNHSMEMYKKKIEEINQFSSSVS